MLVVVDSRIRVNASALPADLRRALKAHFEHANPAHGALKRMGKPTWNVERVIATWREEGAELTLPRGGLARVLATLRGAGVDAEVVDARAVRPAALPAHRRQLRPYQARIVEACVEREQCLVTCPAGGGKTTVLLALASRLGQRTLVVVPTRGLMDQWVACAADELGIPRREVGRVCGTERRLAPLTVALIPSLRKFAQSAECREYFGCVLVDEVHSASAPSAYACVDPFPARYRVGASDSWRRKDRKEFMIRDLFSAEGASVSRAELESGGWILPVEVRLVPTPFRADWYGLPPEDGEDPADGGDPKELDFVRLCTEMENDPARNDLAVRAIGTEARAGKQVLAMVHHRAHVLLLGQMLAAAGVASGYLMGGEHEDRAAFDASLAGLRSGKLRVGVGTYKSLGTGIDLPKLEVGVAVTPIGANEQFFRQVRGRFARPAEGKDPPRLYVLTDPAVFGTRHVQNVARWNLRTVVGVEGAAGSAPLLARGGGKGAFWDWEPVKAWVERWDDARAATGGQEAGTWRGA